MFFYKKIDSIKLRKFNLKGVKDIKKKRLCFGFFGLQALETGRLSTISVWNPGSIPFGVSTTNSLGPLFTITSLDEIISADAKFTEAMPEKGASKRTAIFSEDKLSVKMFNFSGCADVCPSDPQPT